MSRINLLPWREVRRAQCKRQFIITLTIAVSVTVCCMLLIHFVFAHRLQLQKTRDTYVQTQSQIASRIAAIKTLNDYRIKNIKLFEELVRTLPPGVYLVQIKREERTLLLTGKEESNSHLSTLMQNIEKSPSLMRPALQEIRGNIFSLHTLQK